MTKKFLIVLIISIIAITSMWLFDLQRVSANKEILPEITVPDSIAYIIDDTTAINLKEYNVKDSSIIDTIITNDTIRINKINKPTFAIKDDEKDTITIIKELLTYCIAIFNSILGIIALIQKIKLNSKQLK